MNNKEEFLNALKCFVDNPDDIIDDRNNILFSLHGIEIDLKLNSKNGKIICVENDSEFSAEEWLFHKMARLDLLASRIIKHFAPDKYNIPVKGEHYKEIDDDSCDIVNDTVSLIPKLIEEHPLGTNVIYLTAQAGEGKSQIIEKIAYEQARKYNQKETDWLLVPVELGGRPLMRLDEVIIAAFNGVLRFSQLYYDAILEMVKRGKLVLALDGFEEVFVPEGEGEVASTLGHFLNQLHSQGSIVIATRVAYHRYKNFIAQSRFIDAIKENDIFFQEVSLPKWDKNNFVRLGEMFGMQHASSEYDEISLQLTENHPLLTRAVLVRRLVKQLYDEPSIKNTLLSSSGNKSILDEFVRLLIEREADKWLSSDEMRTPILTPQEHEEILKYIAEEMWRNNGDYINEPLLKSVVELLVSEVFKKQPFIATQVVNRIGDHFFLKPNTIYGKKAFSFDHEDFKNYYLGWRIADIISHKQKNEIVFVLQVNKLSKVVEKIITEKLSKSEYRKDILAVLIEIAENASMTSYTKLNASSILIELLHDYDNEDVTINKALFDANVFEGKKLKNILFQNCTFDDFNIIGSYLSKIEIKESIISILHCEKNSQNYEITIDSQSLPATLYLSEKHTDGTEDLGVPFTDRNRIILGIKNTGFAIADDMSSSTDNSPEVIIIDRELELFQITLRIFSRRPYVTDNILRLRLGQRYSEFKNNVFDQLFEQGVIVDKKYTGQKTQEMYELGASLEFIIQCIELSDGSFSKFLERFQTS